MTIKVTYFRIKVRLTTMIAVMTTFIVVKEAVLFLIPSYYNKPDVDDICALKWGLHASLYVKFFS